MLIPSAATRLNCGKGKLVTTVIGVHPARCAATIRRSKRDIAATVNAPALFSWIRIADMANSLVYLARSSREIVKRIETPLRVSREHRDAVSWFSGLVGSLVHCFPSEGLKDHQKGIGHIFKS